jgi:hypothetical protein
MLGGCGLLGGQQTPPVSEQPVQAPPSPQAFPSPTTSLSPDSTASLTLTRPTDPDARLKEKKFGRSDPFQALVSPKPKVSGQPKEDKQELTPDEARRAFVKDLFDEAEKRDAAATRSIPPGTRTATGPLGLSSRGQPSSPGSRPSSSSSRPPGLRPPSGTQGPILPDLPTTPSLQFATQVQFQGVGVTDGPTAAFVSAPGEKISRTVRVGDRLSGGQVLVAAIDVSNRYEPVLVLEEAGQLVTIRLGQAPEVAAASSGSITPIPALYPVRF